MREISPPEPGERRISSLLNETLLTGCRSDVAKNPAVTVTPLPSIDTCCSDTANLLFDWI